MEEPRHTKINYDRWDMDKVRYHLKSPPAPKRETRSLTDILPDVIDGLSAPQSENILILQKAWIKLAGQQISKHSTPGFIKKFTLYVHVDHPSWMPELERIKRVLLRKIQANYKSLSIRNIVFLLENR